MSKLPSNWEPPKRSRLSGLAYLTTAVALLITGYCYGRQTIPRSLPTDNHLGQIQKPLNSAEGLQKCAIDNLLGTGLYFLDNASPIALVDFEERRDRLANALVADEVDAFVVEPGYTFKYYGNVSQPEWEVWEVRTEICFWGIEKTEILIQDYFSLRSAHF
jgi:hypothetical protein